jgi:hypothetical protein
MRINLVTPFAEKDAVKALGARWDPARKVWYIQDVTDLTPFARWIPDLERAKDDGMATAAPRATARATPAAPRSSARNAPPLSVPHCGCKVLPWEACEHSTER